MMSLDVVMNLAQLLDPAMRDPFLRAVAIEAWPLSARSDRPRDDLPRRPRASAPVHDAVARCGAALAGVVGLR
jgi:hypothetical protein